MVKNPRIILIAGSSLAGKSSAALELGAELSITQIVDVDVIREVLRGEYTKKNNPYLFYSSCNAWEYEGDDNPEHIIRAYLKYSETIKKSINRVIDRAYVLGKDVIIEGVHLAPSLFKEYSKNKNFHILLLDIGESRYLSNVKKRQCEFNGREVKRFEERLSKAMIIRRYLLDEAKIYGIPIVVNNSIKQVVEEMVRIIK